MSTTLQELKSQITAANELGVTNITKKGGTIASDATTAEIMAEIDNLPSGGGSAPTVSSEITLDGDITTKESYEIDLTPLGGGTATIYKISDDVLPFGYSDGSELFDYTCIDKDDQSHTPKVLGLEGYVIIGGGFDVISAYFDNYQPTIVPVVLAPSVGTWVLYDDGDYYKSITATPG